MVTSYLSRPLACSCLIIVLIVSTDGEVDPETRVKEAKLDLWSRGAFALDERVLFGPVPEEQAEQFERYVALAPLSLGPVKETRRIRSHGCIGGECNWSMRGGGYEHDLPPETKIGELGKELGPDFIDAIEQNKRDHAADCEASCKSYYCAHPDHPFPPLTKILNNGTEIQSYSMGAVPPEDFGDQFGFPLDLIKVTRGQPLFLAEEARLVTLTAIAEGVDKNEYKSGKYRLGGDWLKNLPKTREWFNSLLKVKLFPLLCHLFPEIISSQDVLRAHSVSLLKYNVSHPRTDIHIDNGILAMTLAMTPQEEYVGGGTFFEHFDNVLPMDVGHGTFRPGSVRHGGHAVTKGTRFMLGAFLLIEDRVEHVRRLKNRGSALRRANDFNAAEKHFQWALAINPKCTTCLKDWGELLYAQNDLISAEEKIRSALELLEEKDSDAFFSLGQVLSAQGRDDESIAAYNKSVQLNADDAELLYNLAIKLGERGDKKEENIMYARATTVDPKFGGAWLNWGTNLAEEGILTDAELMFLKALECGSEVKPKAMINLAIIHHSRACFNVERGDVEGARDEAVQASRYLDSAKPLLDYFVDQGDVEAVRFLGQYKPIRLQCHRIMAQVYASAGELADSEAELRTATESFPEEPMAWKMLIRVLVMRGKTKESEEVLQKISETLLGS